MSGWRGEGHPANQFVDGTNRSDVHLDLSSLPLRARYRCGWGVSVSILALSVAEADGARTTSPSDGRITGGWPGYMKAQMRNRPGFRAQSNEGTGEIEL